MKWVSFRRRKKLGAVKVNPESRPTIVASLKAASGWSPKSLISSLKKSGEQSEVTANDPASTLIELRRQSREGNIDSQFKLGMLLRYGTFEEDGNESLVFLATAAESGHLLAQKQLVDIYLAEMNSDEAAFWWKTTGQHDPQVEYQIAQCYLKQEKLKEALKWFTKAHDNGHLHASEELVLLREKSNNSDDLYASAPTYAKGDRIKRDFQQSIEFPMSKAYLFSQLGSGLKDAIKSRDTQRLKQVIFRDGLDITTYKLALVYVEDPELLQEIALKHESGEIRALATSGLGDKSILKDIVYDEHCEGVHRVAAQQLKDQKLLAEIAYKDKSDDVRLAALTRLENLIALAETEYITSHGATGDPIRWMTTKQKAAALMADVRRSSGDEERIEHGRNGTRTLPELRHTASGGGHVNIDGSKWRDTSPLTAMGYHVGERTKLTGPERKDKLTTIFKGTLNFPEDFSLDKKNEWGKPGSKKRLKKIAEHIDQQIPKFSSRQSYEVAVSDWKDDLDWLNKEFNK